MATVTRDRAGRAPAWLGILAPERADSAARRHLAAAFAFLLAAAGLGFLAHVKLLAPTLLEGHPAWSFGRLYPMYLSALVYGWLTLAGMGVIYYLLPRLTGVRLHFERLANANLWLALAAYGAGIVSIGLGSHQGRPFLEFPLWLDPLVLVTLAVPALVTTANVVHRRERNLYVSLWYFLAATYWMPLLYLVGNLPGLTGPASVLQTWLYAHNVMGLWLGAVVVGALYYVVPKATGNPLYSHGLALIGFWSLAFAHVWASGAWLLYGPVPEWLQTAAVVFAAALAIPVLAVLANLAGTVGRRWDLVRDPFALRFAVLGGAAYLTAGLVIAFQATRSASALIGFTPWAQGTLALVLLGFLTPWVAAFVYHAWPRMIGRAWYSRRAAEAHFRLTAGGVTLVALAFWAVGLASGYTWAAGATTGAFANTGEGFAQTLSGQGLFYFLAMVGMALVAAGQAAFVYNTFRSFTSGSVVPQEVLIPARPPEEGEGRPATPAGGGSGREAPRRGRDDG